MILADPQETPHAERQRTKIKETPRRMLVFLRTMMMMKTGIGGETIRKRTRMAGKRIEVGFMQMAIVIISTFFLKELSRKTWIKNLWNP